MLVYWYTASQVRSARGEVTGVLDIAKCLYDAVTRLQRVAERKSVGGDDGDDDLKMSMLKELGKGKGKKSKAAMQARNQSSGAPVEYCDVVTLYCSTMINVDSHSTAR